MGSEHHSFPLPPPSFEAHDVPRCLAGRARTTPLLGSPSPSPPPPGLGGTRLGAAPCSGLGEMLFVHMKPFVWARGSPAFSQTAPTVQGHRRFPSAGGPRPKVTPALLPDIRGLGSRRGGAGGAGQPGQGTGPAVPPAVPRQPRRSPRPPPLCESRLFFSGCDFQVA